MYKDQIGCRREMPTLSTSSDGMGFKASPARARV
jgi:hypothetical protein